MPPKSPLPEMMLREIIVPVTGVGVKFGTKGLL